MIRILIVEDEPNLRELLENNLSFEGFQPEGHATAEAALQSHRARAADLIVLDLMLPGMDGFSMLQRLRGQGDAVPILMLTARGDESDRVKGLTLGADDYLVKPFSLLELLARVRGLLRRSNVAPRKNVLRSGPFTLNRTALMAYKDGESLDLTPKEYRILEVLILHPGHIHGRVELLKSAWESGGQPTPRTVDAHIGNLRRKLGDENRKGLITTVDGEGYCWTLPVTEEA